MKIEWKEAEINNRLVGSITITLADKEYGVDFILDKNDWNNRTALAEALDWLSKKTKTI